MFSHYLKINIFLLRKKAPLRIILKGALILKCSLSSCLYPHWNGKRLADDHPNRP
ncbi:hypothetical protein GCM10008022_39530 [Paenibacillus hunanensis]|nr:hypothetical protein GCM10008022_39530 [Paenibacillus hunanensis]